MPHQTTFAETGSAAKSRRTCGRSPILEGLSASIGGARLIRLCPSKIILVHGDPSGLVCACVLASRASTVRKCTGTTESDKITRSHPVSLTSAVASTDTTWLGIGTLPHEPALPLSRRASGTAPRGRCPILQRWRPRSATDCPTPEGSRGAAACVFIAARWPGPLLVATSEGRRPPR